MRKYTLKGDEIQSYLDRLHYDDPVYFDPGVDPVLLETNKQLVKKIMVGLTRPTVFIPQEDGRFTIDFFTLHTNLGIIIEVKQGKMCIHQRGKDPWTCEVDEGIEFVNKQLRWKR